MDIYGTADNKTQILISRSVTVTATETETETITVASLNRSESHGTNRPTQIQTFCSIKNSFLIIPVT